MPLTIPANGASQAIYLDMSGSVMRYSIGTLTTPSTYTSFVAGDWPVTINNTPSPSSSNILKVVATQNLGSLPLGKNQTTIQSASFNNGLYYVTILSNGTSVTKKFIKN